MDFIIYSSSVGRMMVSFIFPESLSTALDYKRFNKIDELGGSDPQL